MGRVVILYPILGLCGLLIEIFFTALTSGDITLKGYTSLWCIFIYGTGGLIVVAINAWDKYYKQKMIIQVLVGGLCLTMVEFCFGMIFNVWLGFDLWDYSHYAVNLYGQVELYHTLCWFGFMPFFIWLIDMVGWALYREPWFYSVAENYRELFTAG
jgi:uncharacterized membrane protein